MVNLKNENPIRKYKWKFKFHLEIEKKVHENDENWEITKIDKWWIENN